jgi:flagellar biosynthesis/type III secretory pathway protein FliH
MDQELIDGFEELCGEVEEFANRFSKHIPKSKDIENFFKDFTDLEQDLRHTYHGYTMQSAYDDGERTGYENGEQTGYQNGYDEGVEAGREDVQEAYSEGEQQGYSDGESEGFSTAISQAQEKLDDALEEFVESECRECGLTKDTSPCLAKNCPIQRLAELEVDLEA